MDTMEVENTITGGEEQSLGISSDLIRGHINTIILRSLYEGDKYGYDIIGEIEKKSGGLYTIKQPTLYSALKRLESLKYVESYYGEFSNGGRRKYFSLTDEGKAVTEKNLAEWEYSRTIIDSLISDGNAHYDFSFITDKQTELTELKRSLALREEALNEEKTALASLKNELQRERALLSAQTASLSSQKTDVKELKDKIEAQKMELEEKQTALFEKEGVIQAKETELLEKEQAIETARAEINAQNEKIQELTVLLQSQKAELEDTKTQFSALQENKTTEFYNRGLELRAQQAQMDAQKEKLEDEKRFLQVKEAELSQKEADLTALSEQIESMQTQSVDLEEKTAQLQAKLDEIASKEAEIEALKNALNSERNELDKKNYELTQKEYALEEKSRLESALESDKFREETEKLQQLQKDLDNRQALYNQQQLEFITRKNTLSAEQFAFADKLAKYDESVALLEQEKSKLETEKFALAEDKKALEESVQLLETQKRALEEEKENFERSKAEAERVLQESGQKATSESANLQKQLSELQERELSLAQRETMLNNAIRDFRNQQQLAYQQNEATYQALQNQRFAPVYTQQNAHGDFSDLQRQAQSDGIRLRTAGEQHRETAPSPTPTASANGYFNMGLSLFKSAFIIFCIVAFEALFAYFIRGYLGVSVLYPLIAFAGGFVAFIVFAILYAQGYKAKVRKKKHSSYLLTASVIFVITVIVTTMIAVYFKAETSNPAELLSFVVLPIIYLFNIVLFAIFYRLFSSRSKVNEK